MRPLKTPDVYVDEISLFPPSVAEVETAVPAFVGHTEKATRISEGDLKGVPTKIKSLPDFELYFGKGPATAPSRIDLDANNNFVSATFANNYYLYDSLRLFFDNGGGKCYIVSVGSYSEGVEKEKLVAGVKTLKKYDEPTMILFPDAAGLSAGDLGDVQQQALMQCGDLMDRVGVFDTTHDDWNGVDFRDKIGINNLKYGAAYTPWLNVKLSKNISYVNVKAAIGKEGIYKDGAKLDTFDQLTLDKSIKDLIKQLDDALSDISTIDQEMKKLLGSKSIDKHYQDLVAAYRNTRNLGNIGAIFEFVFKIPDVIEALLMSAPGGVKGDSLRAYIKTCISGTLRKAYKELIANEKELDAKFPPGDPAGDYSPRWSIDPDPASPEWDNIFSSVEADAAKISASTKVDADAESVDERCDPIFSSVREHFSIIREVVANIVASASNYAKVYEESLGESSPVYRKIIKGIGETATSTPPSGAIAGVYAMVDNQRGVWKAPANVSLAGVVGPVHAFDADETDNLNIDVNAGKSVNAIRAFSGKGTLVWGARTLAGNDNEWRYISVRRFFNMVEESVKKSTYWAVFEPNDANTWVKVRGMIENYLMQKWRDGALAGATPKEAFFVRCGLGTTMNSQDILEGRMNVEIGMAVVRPAEFIVLKFSHKLQTS
ncbi:MAG: phage tail sheath family protein [Geobacter sp.]|nr:phage tail sheath family protein [Geobacter sp.]